MTEIMIKLGPPTNALVICVTESGDYYVEDVLRKEGYDAKRVTAGIVIVTDNKPFKFSKE